MKRRLALITLALLIVASLAAPATLAASTEKTLKANYGIQILYNNQVLTSTNQPFIVDGITYVPLRMLMDAFGDKQIAWDNTARKVLISSGVSQMETTYMQQITSRNAQITELQNKVKTLETQLATQQASANDVDLDDLEDALNDDYEDFEDLDIAITLSGDEDKVTVKIAIDDTDWDTLTDSEKENFLQDVCDDIWDEADKADISCTVKDGSATLDSFSVEADDDVSLDDLDLDELEDNLNDDYADYKSLDFEYSLSGDEDLITVKVDIDEDDWDDLTTANQEGLLQDICDDLWDESEDADIKFTIKDGSTSIKTLTVDAGDDVNL